MGRLFGALIVFLLVLDRASGGLAGRGGRPHREHSSAESGRDPGSRSNGRPHAIEVNVDPTEDMNNNAKRGANCPGTCAGMGWQCGHGYDACGNYIYCSRDCPSGGECNWDTHICPGSAPTPPTPPPPPPTPPPPPPPIVVPPPPPPPPVVVPTPPPPRPTPPPPVVPTPPPPTPTPPPPVVPTPPPPTPTPPPPVVPTPPPPTPTTPPPPPSAFNASGSIPVGHAVWVYDLYYGKEQAGEVAMWSDWIGRYNQMARESSRITTVYTYGGDMEYYPDDGKNAYQTYFTKANQDAAKKYKATFGVKYVIAVIDGRMDGGEEWSPDVSLLTVQQVQFWADRLARLYCSFDFIDGVQVDLEPFNGRYRANLLVLMARLSSQLLTRDNNCLNTNHPNGRSLGTFMYATAATPQVFAAMGPNSYIAVSGYDLGNGGPGVAHTPAAYRTALTSQINTLIQNAGTTGRFVIGIPAAASTNEFTTYVTANGAVTQGYPNYSATVDSYIVRAIQTAQQLLAGKPNFLGMALWGCSSEMSYPPHTPNLFYPSHVFATPGAMEYMAQNL